MIFTIIASFLIAALSGLGVGGGGLFVVFLALFTDTPQITAQGINLLFFLPTALISCLFRWKQGKLDLKRILPALVSGILGAVIFSVISRHMDTTLLRKPFGILLLATGLRELLYRERKAR